MNSTPTTALTDHKVEQLNIIQKTNRVIRAGFRWMFVSASGSGYFEDKFFDGGDLTSGFIIILLSPLWIPTLPIFFVTDLCSDIDFKKILFGDGKK